MAGGKADRHVPDAWPTEVFRYRVYLLGCPGWMDGGKDAWPTEVFMYFVNVLRGNSYNQGPYQNTGFLWDLKNNLCNNASTEYHM